MKKYLLLFIIMFIFTSVPCVYAKDTTKNDNTEARNSILSTIKETLYQDFTYLDNFRSVTYIKIIAQKNETSKKIDILDLPSKSTDKYKPTTKPLDGTQKQIAYIQLFLLSVAGFIFGAPIIFYGLIIVIVFFLLRFIYRKIRNR